MIRLAGVQLPDNKRIEIALTSVYGIGPSRSKKILEKLKISKNKKVKEINTNEESMLREELKKYVLEGDLRRRQQLDIKRLVEINCYRGTRHKAGLPVRGQRTKNNARTRKGKKKLVVGGSKAAAGSK